MTNILANFNQGYSILDCLGQNRMYVAGIGVLVIFSWEHYFRMHKLIARPTIGLNIISKQLGKLFNGLGKFLAKVSGFLTFIDFTELIETGYDLCSAIINLATSYRHILKGYINKIKDSYRLHICGTVILIICLDVLYKSFVLLK